MRYGEIVHGTFLGRPNRFLAMVQIGDAVHTVHVKNTGRCKEILVPGAEVILEVHPDAKETGRKTEYSLIAVYKEQPCDSEKFNPEILGNGTAVVGMEQGTTQRMLINMDSQAPNQVAAEWLISGDFTREIGISVTEVRREVRYGNSRFDLAFVGDGKPCFMEVKGVTLEEDGVASFPDAPTERGIKHMQELADAAAHGFGAYLLFVIQMKGIREFRPNRKTHPAFADALKEAAKAGVHVLAYACMVWEDHFQIDQRISVVLD